MSEESELRYRIKCPERGKIKVYIDSGTGRFAMQFDGPLSEFETLYGKLFTDYIPKIRKLRRGQSLPTINQEDLKQENDQ